jgi:hypothetical protein
MEQERRDEEERRREDYNRCEAERKKQTVLDKVQQLTVRFNSLPPEPEKGATIALQLNSARILRRFGLNEPGANVYTWIAWEARARGVMTDFEEFEVRSVQKIITPEQTLEAQGLTGRVMVTVCEI